MNTIATDRTALKPLVNERSPLVRPTHITRTMANVEKKGKWWKKLARKKRMKSSDSGVASFSNGTAEKRPLSKSDDFIVVAIDFGTACSGYAYAFSQYPDVVHLMRRADCGPKERNSIFFKTPTAILLSEHEDFVAFGYEAKEIYSDMEVVDQSRYLYFEKFKMELHYTEVSCTHAWQKQLENAYEIFTSTYLSTS